MEEYYRNNTEMFRVPEERRFGVILAGSKAEAEEALRKIKSGEPFDTVSAAYSIPDLTREERMGSRPVRNGQNPEFDAAGFALASVGDMTEPFETPRGWMVLKLVERRPERIIEMEDAQRDIQGALKTLKNEERLNSLIEKWRTEIKVEIYEKNLEKANVEERPPKSRRYA
jgi:parvulin-like peptidyl-prolyl isomerase